jgi:hypothetical protein
LRIQKRDIPYFEALTSTSLRRENKSRAFLDDCFCNKTKQNPVFIADFVGIFREQKNDPFDVSRSRLFVHLFTRLLLKVMNENFHNYGTKFLSLWKFIFITMEISFHHYGNFAPTWGIFLTLKINFQFLILPFGRGLSSSLLSELWFIFRLRSITIWLTDWHDYFFLTPCPLSKNGEGVTLFRRNASLGRNKRQKTTAACRQVCILVHSSTCSLVH